MVSRELCKHPVHRLRRFEPAPDEFIVCKDCGQGFSWKWVFCPERAGFGKRLSALMRGLAGQAGPQPQNLEDILAPMLTMQELELRSAMFDQTDWQRKAA